MTTLQRQSRPLSNLHARAVHGVDLTRGAVHFGLPNLQVLLPEAVLREYAECDVTLGYNAAGQILSVLSRHVARIPGGGQDDSIAVVLRRRQDDHEVQLHLGVVRTRREGTEFLHLHKIGECDVPD